MTLRSEAIESAGDAVVSDEPVERDWRTFLLRVVVFTVLYLFAWWYTRQLQSLDELRFAYVPAAGVLVGGLLVSPTWMWPGLIGIPGLVGALAHLGVDAPPATFLLISSGVLGCCTAAAWSIRRMGVQHLDEVGQVVRFGGASFVATGLAALPVGFGLAGADDAIAVASAAVFFAGGMGLGIVTIAPLVVELSRGPQAVGERRLEACTALVAVVATAWFAFFGPRELMASTVHYLVLLPLIWIAIRLSRAVSVVAVVAVAHVALLATWLDSGPFAPPEHGNFRASVLLGLFIGVTALMTFVIAARTGEVATLQDHAEARDALLAVVSHELRTPLTAIVGFTELLQRRHREANADERAAMIRVISRNGNHLTSLIDDLLALARSRTEHVPVDAEAVIVEEAVDEIVAERAGEDIEVHSVHPGLRAHVDRRHLQQIVANLLENARRYGQPPVQVDIEGGDHGVRVIVTDHGDGVPPWFVPKLFDPFAQATAGDRRTSRGLGLGLPICRNLARANGGELTYDTGRANGARFVLTLPAARGDQA